MKTILRWLYKPKNGFTATPNGIKKAIFWSKLQKHPNSKNRTLYEYLYKISLDGWENLHIINTYKKRNFNY
jgi:hypothetical protein